jgi:catechol 2,3-dioxygenase-like lactoylglutathione lyase family enzyme
MRSIKADYIDHIAIALNNIEEAEQLYEKVLGFKVKHRETVEDQRVKTSMLVSEQQGISIELLEPIDEDSPIDRRRFHSFQVLKKRGGGSTSYMLSS